MLQKEGLIKCSVLPPKRLSHPVLPFCSNNKLLFCLCKSCATEQNFENKCVDETVAERALPSTWIIDEVRLVVQNFMRSSRFSKCTNMMSRSTISKRDRAVSLSSI